MTHNEAAKITALIIARYPVPELPATTSELWVELFEDLDYEITKPIVMRWIAEQDERLEPAQLRRLVARHYADEAGLGWLDWDAAWCIVERAIIAIGHYRPFPSTYRFVRDVVERMGWEAICLANDEDRSILRGQFRMAYQAAIEREERRAAGNPGAVPDQALPPIPSDSGSTPPITGTGGGELPSIPKRLGNGRALLTQMHEALADKAVPWSGPQAVERAPIPAELSDEQTLREREQRKQVLAEQARRLRGDL